MIRIPRFDNRVPQRVANRQAASDSPGLVVKANEAQPDTADVLLYNEIGFWGTTAKDFAVALANVSAKTINLHINSPGGDVFDGIAMFNTLKRHSARVVVTVDGLAASAASIVAMAGDEVRMNQGSFLMIHRAWALAAGNTNELTELAEVLAKIDGELANAYAERTGRKAETMLKMMDAETWMSADEAVDEKFADAVNEAPAAKAAFDLTIFNNAPEPLVAAGRQKKNPRDLETLLRDAGGLSRSEAKRAVAAVKQESALRDEEFSELANVFRSHRS